MRSDVVERASLHAALGDPVRLGIVEDLASSDRSPTELAEAFGLASNLLAHHLDVLENVGLIDRFVSAGDRRRRYVRLVREPLADLGLVTARAAGSVLFVCSHNSARSQLAAGLYQARTGHPPAQPAPTPQGVSTPAPSPQPDEPASTSLKRPHDCSNPTTPPRSS